VKRFVLLFLASLALFGGTVALINYRVDPSGIFIGSRGGPELQLAKILSEKSNALVGFNFDERIFQMFRVRMEKAFPPMIITGSSRTMPISSQTLRAPCLNMSVSGASLEDHIALAIAAKHKPGSKVFLLGMDPWAFNTNLGPTGWRSISDSVAAALTEIGLTTKVPTGASHSKYLQLLNYDYTKASVELLFHPGRSKREITATTSESPSEDRALIRSDGSREGSLRSSNSDQEAINKLAIENSKPPVTNLNNFELSNQAIKSFLLLVDCLSRQGRVVLVLPPYHPLYYSRIVKTYPEVVEVEQILKSEAAKRNIPVIGSYDPDRIGCVDSDFIDGMHPTEGCWKKLFSGPQWKSILTSGGGMSAEYNSQ